MGTWIMFPVLFKVFLLFSLVSWEAESSIPRSTNQNRQIVDHSFSVTINGNQATTRPFHNDSGGNYSNGDESHNENITNNKNIYFRPPWNLSPKINSQGFLQETYRRIPGTWEASANLRGRHAPHSQSSKSLSHIPVVVRQVPGDGNCLFHSIMVCLSLMENGHHLSMEDEDSLWELKRESMKLRQLAVEFLGQNPRRKLFLQGGECMRARDLVEAAASQYSISGQEYCNLMAQDSYWGGGPEIVALCNVLKRPIHVYELVDAKEADVKINDNERSSSFGQHYHTVNGGLNGDPFVTNGAFDGHESRLLNITRKSTHFVSQQKKQSINKEFYLRRMAAFGSPKFDSKEPLLILSADSRFPDVDPFSILPSGNHFLALFPVSIISKNAKCGIEDMGIPLFRKRRVRGGAAADENSLSSGERLSEPCSFWDNEAKRKYSSSQNEWSKQLSLKWSSLTSNMLTMLSNYHRRKQQKPSSIIRFWVNLLVQILAYTGI